jgi:NadR type nicotinamide-nucleotide adenylyltransferase
MRPTRVVLIGPECTGKTWLARELATHYDAPWATEHARDYVEGHRRALTEADVDPIGQGQKATEDAAIARAEAAGSALVVLDTDLVSTMVYSRHYYGDCPRWIEEHAARRLADLYLLHRVDVPWVPDGLQREQPERRAELFERFQRTLLELGARTADTSGPWDERRRRAVTAVDALLARRSGAAR